MKEILKGGLTGRKTVTTQADQKSLAVNDVKNMVK